MEIQSLRFFFFLLKPRFTLRNIPCMRCYKVHLEECFDLAIAYFTGPSVSVGAPGESSLPDCTILILLSYAWMSSARKEKVVCRKYGIAKGLWRESAGFAVYSLEESVKGLHVIYISVERRSVCSCVNNQLNKAQLFPMFRLYLKSNVQLHRGLSIQASVSFANKKHI